MACILILFFKIFFMKAKNLLIKILSIGIGLAIGFILIAKVCFELSYDTFYKDYDRIYLIKTGYERETEGTADEFGQVSGGVAPGFKQYVPGVEAATRFTRIYDDPRFITEDQNIIEGGFVIADTSFFKVFDRPILYGNPVEVLSRRLSVMVSRSFAEKLGGIDNAIGKIITPNQETKVHFTIEGVFEDFPRNSTINVDVLLSMVTYSKWSSENWIGNDRYFGFVKLEQGVDPESLSDAIHKMQEANQDLEELEENGIKLWYFLSPAKDLHTSGKAIRNLLFVLSLVAFLLIFTSVLNYILVALYSVVNRSREIGVRKCYGASNASIYALLFKEAAWHFLAALALAAAIIFSCNGVIRNLMNVSLPDLFVPATWKTLAIICVLIFLVSAWFPARLFVKIPVSSAFRNFREAKRRWKQGLLFLQFAFSTALVVLLIVMSKQYDLIISYNPGYEYETIVYFNTQGVDNQEKIYTLVDELRNNPEIEAVEASSTLPMEGASGNNVMLPGSDKELINIADQYLSTEGMTELLGLKMMEGREAQTPNEVMVSSSFVEKMSVFANWNDGAIGKGIVLSEHSLTNDDIFTICGVYEDYRIGTIQDSDNRPSMRFYGELGKNHLPYIYVKLRHLTSENIAAVQDMVKDAGLGKEIDVLSYKEEMRNCYSEFKKIGKTILIGGIFAMLVAVVGLIGYIKDETNRRSREMAIRKVNGAQSSEILKIFIGSMLKISMLAFAVGDLVSYFVVESFLEQFAVKISISPWHFIFSDIFILVVVVAVVFVNSMKIAFSNPINSIKKE